MNGRQLAEQALRRKPSLKVLYTTGYARNAKFHPWRPANFTQRGQVISSNAASRFHDGGQSLKSGQLRG
jgi:hypothetical protein